MMVISVATLATAVHIPDLSVFSVTGLPLVRLVPQSQEVMPRKVRQSSVAALLPAKRSLTVSMQDVYALPVSSLHSVRAMTQLVYADPVRPALEHSSSALDMAAKVGVGRTKIANIDIVIARKNFFNIFL